MNPLAVVLVGRDGREEVVPGNVLDEARALLDLCEDREGGEEAAEAEAEKEVSFVRVSVGRLEGVTENLERVACVLRLYCECAEEQEAHRRVQDYLLGQEECDCQVLMHMLLFFGHIRHRPLVSILGTLVQESMQT